MKKLLKTLAGETQSPPPFWFMRQAGRYLPEYRETRKAAGGFLPMCLNPETAAEITLQPIRRFAPDAAIIFSDILMVPMALGQKLWFAEGEGPRLEKLSPQNIPRELNLAALRPVFEALALTKSRLDKNTALIGFAGAPWTVATYMIEGGSSKNFLEAKRWMYEMPESFDALIEALVQATAQYLIEQVKAGAEALQLFDSWAGVLAEKDFIKYSIEPAKKIVSLVKSACPEIKIIGFPRGAAGLYSAYAKETGVDAIGIDQYFPLSKAREFGKTVQGNLDPSILAASASRTAEDAKEILAAMSGKPFIFNLGHGILPETPVENVMRLCQTIRGE